MALAIVPVISKITRKYDGYLPSGTVARRKKYRLWN